MSSKTDHSKNKLARFAAPIALVVLFLLFQNSLADHAAHYSNPYATNDDARAQITPFYRSMDPALFQDDYITDYYLDAFLPFGYRVFYSQAAKLQDPIVFSKLLTYVLLAVLLIAAYISAWQLGGHISGFTTAALILSSSFFLWRITGALPRGFASPLMALTLLAIIQGRILFLAIVTLLGAVFYPMAAVLSGFALAIQLLVRPSFWGVNLERWTLGKRISTVCVTGLLAALLVVPVLFSAKPYGRLLTPQDAHEYPEIGPGGRLVKEDQPPFPGLMENIWSITSRTFIGGGKTFSNTTRSTFGLTQPASVRATLTMIGVHLWILIGIGLLVYHKPQARRLLVYLISMVVAHRISICLHPYFYMPTRYISYPWPVFLVIALPVSAAGYLCLFEKKKQRPVLKPAFYLAVSLSLLLIFGMEVRRQAGFFHIPPLEIYQHISSLPKNAMVAGWPAGLMDNVPEICKRRALMTWETHQPLHENFVIETRGRMNAIIDATFATDLAPILHLQKEYGVTHFVFDANYLRRNPPSYHKPFDERIPPAHAKARKEGFELLRHMKAATTFTDSDYVVFDLAQLEEYLKDSPPTNK